MYNEQGRRLDRIELLLRAMHDDCAVHGVLWSRETEAMLAEIALARRELMEVEDATNRQAA